MRLRYALHNWAEPAAGLRPANSPDFPTLTQLHQDYVLCSWKEQKITIVTDARQTLLQSANTTPEGRLLAVLRAVHETQPELTDRQLIGIAKQVAKTDLQVTRLLRSPARLAAITDRLASPPGLNREAAGRRLVGAACSVHPQLNRASALKARVVGATVGCRIFRVED